MTPHRIFFGAASLIALIALLPLGGSTAKAEGVIASDVMFPEHHSGYGGPAGPYLVVDGIGRGRGVYATIQEALDDAPRLGGQILVKTAPDGVYHITKPLIIRKPVVITNFGGGIVRVRAEGSGCALVDLRREGGKVVISGIAFETSAPSGVCIEVQRATEFALLASAITAIEGPGAGDEMRWCRPASSDPRPKMRCDLVGVLVQSGLATIQGNQIRRTGTAIALMSPIGEAHKVQGNYIAGNGVGVYVTSGSKFVIERNGIFRNHNYGVILEDGMGLVADNDIEDNWTGLKIAPPSAFSGVGAGGPAALDYNELNNRPEIRIERNLVTQYGVYRKDARNLKQDPPYARGHGPESVDDPHSHDGEPGHDYGDADRKGYAIDFALDETYLQDNVYDYPKKGRILSGVSIKENCFFGPSTSWFDRDRFMPLIAGDQKHVGNDALTPLWFFDANTWVEHLDYDGVDDIDAKNAIESPRYQDDVRGIWEALGSIFKPRNTAIHNWFARNKKEMVCTFRFTGSPVVRDGRSNGVVSAPGNWPRFDTNPVR